MRLVHFILECKVPKWGWQDNSHKEKQVIPLVPFVFSIPQLWVLLILCLSVCSCLPDSAYVAASGACLQSNRLSPLFLCFLSVLSDRRQGWGKSATSSCTGMCCLLMLVSPGTCRSCHFSFQSQHLKCQNTKGKIIFKTSNSLSLTTVFINFNLWIFFSNLKKIIDQIHASCLTCISLKLNC